MSPVYHVELRAFPHVARAFNLEREALDARFVGPWVAGEMIDYQDHRFPPEKTRLTILEDAEPFDARRGLGRGWGEATRRGRDVTETVLAEVQRGADARPEVETLKLALTELSEPLRFVDAIALAAAAHPLWRASEQLSLAEQAVWEALHQGRLEMLEDGVSVTPARWQEVVLSWATWTGAERPGVRLRSAIVPRSAQ